MVIIVFEDGPFDISSFEFYRVFRGYVFQFTNAQLVQYISQFVCSNRFSLLPLKNFPAVRALFLIAAIAKCDGVSQCCTSSGISCLVSYLHVRELDIPTAILTFVMRSIVEGSVSP